MPPLNFKDVNRKFWQFLLLFSIAVFVLLFAFYFNMRLPILENKVLREQLKPYSSSLEQQEDVKLLIDSLQNYLKKYSDAKPGYADILSGKINYLTPKLSEKAKASENEILNVLCTNYEEMYKDKNIIHKLNQEIDEDSVKLVELEKIIEKNDEDIERLSKIIENLPTSK